MLKNWQTGDDPPDNYEHDECCECGDPRCVCPACHGMGCSRCEDGPMVVQAFPKQARKSA